MAGLYLHLYYTFNLTGFIFFKTLKNTNIGSMFLDETHKKETYSL